MTNWRRMAVLGLLAGAVALACLPFLLGGCAGGPPRFLYTPETNVVSEAVVPVTNTVTVTNFVFHTVTVTNALPAAADGTPRFEVVPTVIKDGTLSNYTVVSFQTNREYAVSYRVSTNGDSMARAVGSVTNIFAPGMGDLVGKALVGALGIVGLLFGRKYKKEGEAEAEEHQTTKDLLGKTAASLGQTIQVYREVAQSTPQGQLVDTQLKAWMQQHQQVAGVVDIVSHVVANEVNDEAAKDLAAKVQAEANRLMSSGVAAPGTGALRPMGI